MLLWEPAGNLEPLLLKRLHERLADPARPGATTWLVVDVTADAVQLLWDPDDDLMSSDWRCFSSLCASLCKLVALRQQPVLPRYAVTEAVALASLAVTAAAAASDLERSRCRMPGRRAAAVPALLHLMLGMSDALAHLQLAAVDALTAMHTCQLAAAALEKCALALGTLASVEGCITSSRASGAASAAWALLQHDLAGSSIFHTLLAAVSALLPRHARTAACDDPFACLHTFLSATRVVDAVASALWLLACQPGRRLTCAGLAPVADALLAWLTPSSWQRHMPHAEPRSYERHGRRVGWDDYFIAVDQLMARCAGLTEDLRALSERCRAADGGPREAAAAMEQSARLWAQSEARVLRWCCGNLGCRNAAGRADWLKGRRLCGGCRSVRYCSPQCQAQAWQACHRHTCRLHAAATSAT
jgi:hypothetical protein